MKEHGSNRKSVVFVLASLVSLSLFIPALHGQPSCTANFKGSPTSGCAPLTVRFADNSQNAILWKWLFPGGTPSSASGKGPHDVTYAKAGTYSVRLDITCAQGNDTETKINYIVVDQCPCEADFTGQPTAACVGQKVTFTDQSTNAVGWLWSFPGGTPSVAQTRGPHEVTYAKAGDYTVSLQVFCGSGSDAETKTGYIHIGDCTCTADFTGTPVSGPVPLTVRFTDQSNHADSWTWTFPGGTPSGAAGQGPHDVTYQQEGYYDVKLDIRYGNYSDTRIREDYIHPWTPRYDFGDAPEDALAYPASGVIGKFPTCPDDGPAGFVRHANNGRTYLGNSVDYETDGNGGRCPTFSPDLYDQDETGADGDCGVDQGLYTIRDSGGTPVVVPLLPDYIDSLGSKCEIGKWGTNLDLWYYTENPEGSYVNVLIDWNQDGEWGGEDSCTPSGVSTPERVLRNFHNPDGNGFLSFWHPPDFKIGPNPGYVWARFTITEEELPWNWNGEGDFANGETEDHLLLVGDAPLRLDFGDLPACYGTRLEDDGAYHIIHRDVYLGKQIDDEPDGIEGPPGFGDDLNGLDDEDGVAFGADTLAAGDTTDVQVEASVAGYLKGWFDFNGDGDFDDDGETAFDNFQVAPGGNAFRLAMPMNAKEGPIYARFRYSTAPIVTPKGPCWDGEIEDYVIVCRASFDYEFGDAPEGALAYPVTGVMGNFPTCQSYDAPPVVPYRASGFIRHGFRGLPVQRWFGDGADLEPDGNAGHCSAFVPDGYDLDETVGDGDAGLDPDSPKVYAIRGEPGSERLVPLGGLKDLAICSEYRWGEAIDMSYTVNSDLGAYINVLFDWNQDGRWTPGHTSCGYGIETGTREHVVKNLFVPRGTGRISDHFTRLLSTGKNRGYVWARFSITEREVPLSGEGDDSHWMGDGIFADGETEDYLFHLVSGNDADYGDAPDSSLAYPATGRMGYFPTCSKPIAVGDHYILHERAGQYDLYFGYSGGQPTTEMDGNHGFCGCSAFTRFNKDVDEGLLMVRPYTITGPEGAETVVEDPAFGMPGDWDAKARVIGTVCGTARWGEDIDLAIVNRTTDPVYINALFDWNQNGRWGDTLTCGESGETVLEHALRNFEINATGASSGIRAWGFDPPDFRIGPHSGYVWARFTISAVPIELPWSGNGHFHDGETEDYLLKVSPDWPMFEYGDAWLGYRTSREDGGAVHRLSKGFWLGDTADVELDGQADPNAMGDDLAGADDEDGVIFKTALERGKTAAVQITTSGRGMLNGWIDFSANGSWGDFGEHVINDHQADAGLATYWFAVPDSAVPGRTFARFRLSDVGGLSFDGPVLNEQSALPPAGEVEDYAVTIGPGSGVDEPGRNAEGPSEFRLSQNYPNPFNPGTSLRVAVPRASRVRIVIYDLAGRELAVLTDEHRPAGEFTVQWDGRDGNGLSVPSGVYLAAMTADGFTSRRKLLLMK